MRDHDVVVLALPRGGVPVAFEVAEHLGAPLDVIVVRKLGLPMQPEMAMGAIGENGVRFIDQRLVAAAGVRPQQLAAVEAAEREELDRRVRRYRGDRPGVSLQAKIALVVDDGIATGSTARAAATVARIAGASAVVVAAPVGPRDVADRLGDAVDSVVLVMQPDPFVAIGGFYDDFTQTTDEEVRTLLEANR